MTSKRAFLAQLDLFRALEAEELDALDEISDEYTFEEGAVIAYQRDVGDGLIIVREGRLFAFSVDEAGVVRGSRSYLPGDHFGELWLFAEGPHPATVRGGSAGRLILISGDDFRHFLQFYPDAIEGLAFSEEGMAAAEKSLLVDTRREYQAASLLPEELVEYWSRRSRYLLALKLTAPTIIALGFLALGLIMVVHNVFGDGTWATWSIALMYLASLLFFVATGIQYLDWYNDYFVVTNQHVVHHEFSLRTFQVETRKIPLNQIQSVEVEKPNLLATLLNVGTVRITTAAIAGLVIFDYIDQPRKVRDIIDELLHRVEALDYARTQETMRRAIEEHFQVQSAFERILEEEDDEEVIEPEPAPRLSLRTRLRRGLSSRIETDYVISYRKHFYVMMRAIWWPLLLETAILAGGVLSLANQPLATAICGASALLSLPVGAWLIWRFEDWRNETFQITDLYVIDVDRRPFGFGESRKQASLANVQNVSAVRPGLLATLLNFGNVEIEVAGSDANITFENVTNPKRVQADVFQRLSDYRRRASVREGQERRKEYAVLLDVYQQAQEQQRIPRRTPAPGARPEADQTP